MIQRDIETIMKQYVLSQAKAQNLVISEQYVEQETLKYVEESYTSFLSDNFGRKMTNMLPMFTSQQ